NAVIQKPVVFGMKNFPCLPVYHAERLEPLRQRVAESRRYISQRQKPPKGNPVQHLIISPLAPYYDNYLRIIFLGGQPLGQARGISLGFRKENLIFLTVVVQLPL